MTTNDYDYLSPYFDSPYHAKQFYDRVEQSAYQLQADCEAARLSLLDTSTSRANHWFVVYCIDGKRTRAKALYGPFLSPAQANAELRLVEKFMSIHAVKYPVFTYVEVACMPYQSFGLWNAEIDGFKAAQSR